MMIKLGLGQSTRRGTYYTMTPSWQKIPLPVLELTGPVGGSGIVGEPGLLNLWPCSSVAVSLDSVIRILLTT